MPRTVSIGAKIKQLYGLCGTADLNAWEDGFVSDLYTKTQWATKTEWVTEKQIEVIDRLYERHFA